MGTLISFRCFRASIFVFVILVSSSLFAQTEPSSFWAPDLNSPRAEKPFPQANWEFFGGVRELTTYTPRSQSLGFFTLGAGYFVLDNVSVNAEFGVAPGNLECECDPVRAFNGMFVARWHALNRGRLSLFVDGGVGALRAEHFLGAGSRSDDLLLSAGVGAAWRISGNIHVALDARYTHVTGGSALSNNRTRSAEAADYGVSLVIVK
jgi:opacity protein-like surface antigen